MAPRAIRSKVKSGCQTCKTRKVKCDEGKPVCFRCYSTGRVCEGYGVWGGGGNHYGRRPIGSGRKSLTCFYTPTLVKAVNKEETRYLEWFTYRSVLKLPGVFSFEFWDKLIFQAASSEPAVLHSILALSSAHRTEGLCFDTSLDVAPDKQEHFTLEHYTKAITHLQPHFTSRSNQSIRVALITCLMFVVMEYLRGHFKTGYNHLQNGLKLLNEFQARSSAIDSYSLFQEPCCDSADAWIIQAFIRLDEDCSSDIPATPLKFQSPNQARQHLDRILSQIFYLSHECRHQVRPLDKLDPQSLPSRQQRLRAKLDSWYDAFKESKASLVPSKIGHSTVAYIILRIYYMIAEIMVDTCIRPEDQMRYDTHTKSFKIIMDQLNYIRSLSLSPPLATVFHFSDTSSSITDLGAIPALYYIALKCRVRSIRRDTIGFLLTTTHKEGIWCSHLAARIIEEVINIEEGDFYADSNTAKAVLPESHRLHDIEVQLPDGYDGTAVLQCKRRFDDSNWEVITRELVYDTKTQRWVSKFER
ncbi:hypothetical protein F5Y00DRAFT_253981 [Daldinia vernicosa]|uniref:uncharacterized protein n=1 Tax=Daldinia vernicosa TaxID=114800 RepID=UPI002007BF0C|nr:uncharacterized protein F5Y00DRAFT_253981 [Daldinia vernicosa]KAI0847422.1 hypothetical protein F5Y00DRAFT_253981 [Daldinia vernicosa]